MEMNICRICKEPIKWKKSEGTWWAYNSDGIPHLATCTKKPAKTQVSADAAWFNPVPKKKRKKLACAACNKQVKYIFGSYGPIAINPTGETHAPNCLPITQS